MGPLITQYKKLEAEYELLVEICEPLFQIKYKLEALEHCPQQAELLSSGVLAESSQYLKKLTRSIQENEEQRYIVAANCLEKDHGIHLGEKIPFNNAGGLDSGHLRVEQVKLYFQPDWDSDIYMISGHKFRKDGKIGKQMSNAYLNIRLS